MAFKQTTRRPAVPTDPEALYRQLARTNVGPDNLWGHQTDILRIWHEKYRKNSDVALELPTGAGKTLVGGLIADWVRQTEQQPVAYLCPNRQLAVQAATRLREYGVPTSLLIGRVHEWDPTQRARYTTADAVAVSTYSHVFNSNPALIGAGTLVLDDAHAGEQPIASAWSLSIHRDEPAYQSVLSVIADALDPLLLNSLRDDDSVRKFHRTVFLASPLGIMAHAAELESALQAAITAGRLNKNQSYTLSTLAGNLGNCMVYVSFRRILIRPLISPTSSHTAFSDPARRVYMSATLGAGGELERSFGRTSINRMPVPRGWDKQGTGRRFFVFPEVTKELTRDDDGLGPWLKATIGKHGRATLLAPSTHVADEVISRCLPDEYVRLQGSEIEQDMATFTQLPKSLLDLANRYDGVDLPDDACRLLILAGLPAQSDLQERFLYDALGAGSVLQERLRARIIQGAGRATRNTHDFATVVVIGDDLTNFIIRPDVLRALREELQAEIEFGREQSLDRPIADVDENIDTFLEQGNDWLAVEDEIVADRDNRERHDPPATAEFAKSAPFEVAAIEALWDGDLPLALENARKALDALSGRPQAKRYAALWHYLASCWTRVLSQQGDPSGTLANAANRFASDARAAARGTTWLSHITAPADVIASADEYDDLDREAARQIVAVLASDERKQNDADLREAKLNLAQTKWKKYEAGLVMLGMYAGATEFYGNSGAQSAPDATWIFGDKLWVVWEAKSEALPSGMVSTKAAREATGHMRFIADKRGSVPPHGSFTCLATPQTQVDHSARAICGDDVYLTSLHDPADLLGALERAWVKVRSLGAAVDEAGVLSALKAERCLPSQWIPMLTQKRVNETANVTFD